MHIKTFPHWVINTFFIIGLVSALLFRLIIVFNYIDYSYSRIAWYTGVVGYVLFFGFRFYISLRRRKIITLNKLLPKINDSNLSQIDKDDIGYILNSLLKSKEMFNYIFIFALSGIAIIIDILMFNFYGK